MPSLSAIRRIRTAVVKVEEQVNKAAAEAHRKAEAKKAAKPVAAEAPATEAPAAKKKKVTKV